MEEGIIIMLPKKYAFLPVIADQFSFLDEDQIVKYQFLPSNLETVEFNEASQVFAKELDKAFGADKKETWVKDIEALVMDFRRCQRIWIRFSRNLTITVLDKVIQESIIKPLSEKSANLNHLFYYPDSTKLCMGRPTRAEEAAPFAKILQKPEKIGNIFKQANVGSTTIDDMAVETHKINRIKTELRGFLSVSKDVLDICQSVGHDKVELPIVLHYIKHLRLFIRTLEKPLRRITEHDIQVLHRIAQQLKVSLKKSMASSSSQKTRFATRLQNQLVERRSDGNTYRANFSEAFILDTEEVIVRKQKLTKDGEKVVVRQKQQVELNATHQTLPLRIREVIRARKIISGKTHVVIALDGQRSKQLEYVIAVIDLITELCGNKLSIHLDNSLLSEEQTEKLAARVKPNQFFAMVDIEPEPEPGMEVTVRFDTLSGTATAVGANPA